ncbi:type III-A CRISPR-associated RAMP protein Csm4 [Vulcanisaeta distributa]|uniref:CRISPR system Cms protein Csm4 n=1 Tax=Vulcanisaeta distributa (strain DSM 14429 / JCM 11212 / NBRC 100878 / IC-017) TaxID=572478 RepID=E1QQW9_VULDI|nr:hypothetical protein [Vulcanisaeta distributa]ADN50539.1 conserved hypothetical protein [Vulcanisaeta distributa DSM 14429]
MRINYAVVRFEEPFRVGRTGLMDTLDYVPSDTVYSALENLRHLGISHGIDRASSMYPMAFEVDGEAALTVPMPMDLKIQLLSSIASKYADDPGRAHAVLKRVKKLKYLPLDCLNAPSVEPLLDDDLKVRCGGREFTYRSSYGSSVSIQRNVVGRVLSNADTYRVAAFQPHVNYVLYFTTRDGASLDEARRALELLGKVGVGGERSIGLGHFTVVKVDAIDSLRDSGSHALLLGTALPRSREVYGCVNTMVRGWVCSSPFYVMGPVSVITDGSVVGAEYLDFETLNGPNCVKRLDPLWLWYEARYQC